MKLDELELRSLEKVKKWSRVTNPVFSLLRGSGSWCMWSAASRSMCLEEENRNVLVCDRSIEPYRLMAECIPPSWSITWARMDLLATTSSVIRRHGWDGLEEVSLANIKDRRAGKIFHYVFLCNPYLDICYNKNLKLSELLMGSSSVFHVLFDRAALQPFPHVTVPAISSRFTSHGLAFHLH